MPPEQQTVIERSAAPKPLRKTPAFLTSAGLVAALLAVGAVAAVDRMFAEPADAAPAAAPSPSASAEPEAVGADDEGTEDSQDTAAACGMGASSKDEFTAFPDDTAWDDRVAGAPVPSSDVHGPGKVQDSGYRHCFAKSPQGAVLAGLTAVAMSADPETADAVAKHSFAEDAEAQAAQGEGAAGGSSALGQSDRLDGARLAAYGSDRARVDVAISAAGANPSAVRVDLVWEQDDWKTVPADGGAVAGPASPLQDTTGFVATPAAEQEQPNPLS